MGKEGHAGNLPSVLSGQEARGVGEGVQHVKERESVGFWPGLGEAKFLQKSHRIEHLTLLVIIILVGTATVET